MNAFRRPSGTLKLVSLSWRKSIAPRQFTICNYSTVTEPKDSPEPAGVTSSSRKSTEAIDPFGIGEVVDAEDKSSVLVQGFYHQTDDPNSASKPTPPPSALPPPKASPTPPETEDPDQRSRLSLYNTWLKQRIEREAVQKSDIGATESFREAHFGHVRIDTDNPVVSHGHYDDRMGINEKPPSSRRWRASRNAPPPSSEPITETIEAGHSVRIRASEFLKQYRQLENASKENSEEDDTSEQPDPGYREKVVIEKTIRPRVIGSLDPNDPKNQATSLKDALQMDSNVIPKPYLLPNYNAITELDMWAVLKKTVVFQNDFLLAINKPPGIPVHSKARDCRHTIIQFLDKFADLAKVPEIFPLHRIDKETTGVLLFAKDKKVASILKEKFANREIQKFYLGVTKLCPKVREGTIKIPIGEGKIPGSENKYRRVLRPDLREYGIKATTRTCVEAITNFRVVNSIQEAAFVEIEPVTGYKHQIRVHFGMGLGCPIFGDHKYSHRDRLAPQRLHPYVLHKIKLKQTKVREMPLHLHCNKISFTLPEEFTGNSEPVYIHATIPYFMKYTLKRLGLIR